MLAYKIITNATINYTSSRSKWPFHLALFVVFICWLHFWYSDPSEQTDIVFGQGNKRERQREKIH